MGDCTGEIGKVNGAQHNHGSTEEALGHTTRQNKEEKKGSEEIQKKYVRGGCTLHLAMMDVVSKGHFMALGKQGA